MLGKKSKLAGVKADVRRNAPQAPRLARRVTPRETVQKALALFEKLAEESNRNKGWSYKVVGLIENRNLIPNLKHTAFGDFGVVPGVESGDIFLWRAQLRLVGLHRRPLAGIDWKDTGRDRTDGHTEGQAISIVVSDLYEDNVDEGETLVYTGEGGKDGFATKKQTRDQKLEGATEALYNTCFRKLSVRVIRGKLDAANKKKIYSYDGLYQVVSYVYEPGKSGFKVYKFRMVREPNQAPLVWSPPERHPARGSKRTTVHGRQGVPFYQEHIVLSDEEEEEEEEEEEDVDLEEDVGVRSTEEQAEPSLAEPPNPEIVDLIDTEGDDEDVELNRDNEDLSWLEDDEEPRSVQEQGERARDFSAEDATAVFEEPAGDFRAEDATGFVEERAGDFGAEDSTGFGFAQEAAEGNAAGVQAADLNDGKTSTGKLFTGEDVEMPEFLSAGAAIDVEELVSSFPRQPISPEPVDADSRMTEELLEHVGEVKQHNNEEEEFLSAGAKMDMDELISSIAEPIDVDLRMTEELPEHIGEENLKNNEEEEFLSAVAEMDVDELITRIAEPVDVDSRSDMLAEENIGDKKLDNKEEEEDSDATPEGEWEVDSILDRRYVTRRHKRFKEYLVLWKDYPVEDASWEPVAHLTHCAQELEDFENLVVLKKSLGEKK